jgi:hypothetical protein
MNFADSEVFAGCFLPLSVSRQTLARFEAEELEHTGVADRKGGW